MESQPPPVVGSPQQGPLETMANECLSRTEQFKNEQFKNDNSTDNSSAKEGISIKIGKARGCRDRKDDNSSYTSGSRAFRKRGTASNMSRSNSFTASNMTQLTEKKPAAMKTSSSVIYGRLTFLLVFLAAAGLLGFAAFYLMVESEKQRAEDRFDSIATRALSVAQLVIEEKKKATDSLALMVGSANPHAAAWPFVYLDGYQEIASSLGIVTEGSLSFCPLVEPGGEEQKQFEDFAYNLFYNISGFPDDTGVSAFGRGVFAYGTGQYGNETWPDFRYHSDGWTYHYGPNNILVPFIQSDHGAHTSLMLNVYFEHRRAAAIDVSIECARERAAANDATLECGSITDLMISQTNAAGVKPGAAGLMMVPIFPRLDNLTITGFIVGKQIWHDLLKHGFESDVNGLEVVLRTETQNASYKIVNGKAEEEVEILPADYYNRSKGFSKVGTRINPRYFTNKSVAYYMDIYSTAEYMNSYRTDTPRDACIGVVLIMGLTALLFFCYDYFVRREFHDKKKLLEAKRQFVRFVSHEVRTPLNTVCLGLSLLQHDFARVLGMEHPNASTTKKASPPGDGNKQSQICEDDVEEWLQLSTQVCQNAEAAVGVLSDLLNYDKIQMGNLTLELSLIPIWVCLERTVNEFKIAAVEKKVNLSLDLTRLLGEEKQVDVEAPLAVASLPFEFHQCKVVGDSVKLVQVFRNLISNGLKFSSEGGSLTVRVMEKKLQASKRREEMLELHKEHQVLVERRGHVVIQVIDSGVGMTREQVNTVFDDGTQFNANKFQAGGGSGLGMNIAKGVVNQHDGKLWASSAGLGLGSTFTVMLPLYNSQEEEIQPSRPTEATSSQAEVSVDAEDSEFALQSLYILVVDDAISNRKLCVRLLERNGHKCDGAGDGQEALDMVKKSMEEGKPYDCILLDYEMPIMTGPEACERMRKFGCSAYIAGVTGNLMSEDVEYFRSCGANCVLSKPFRLDALEAQLVEDGVTPHEKQENIVRVE